MSAGELSGPAPRAEALQVGRRSAALALATAFALVALALVLLVPQTTGGGWEMDEGAVLAYAERVLQGDVPHRDFLTFYGPGNPWLVAGALAVFGARVEVERAVGVLYRILVVLALFVLAWRLAGLLAGALAALVSLVLMAEELVWAYATYGSIAFALAGLALAVLAVGAGEGSRALALGAGLAAGVAVLMRYDFVLAIVVSAAPLFLYVDSRLRVWYAGGFAVTVGVYLPYALVVGPERIGRVAGDMLATGSGRRLPLPLEATYPGRLLVLATVVALALVAVGAVMAWRRRGAVEGRIVLAAGLFSIGLAPWVFSRPDIHHIRPAAIVPLSLLPALLVFGAQELLGGRRARVTVVAVVAGVTLGFALASDEIRLPRMSDAPAVESSERAFPLSGARTARDVTRVVSEVERLSSPGESLFVGPLDLRRLNYGPTYVYFLLPQLEPASYYMELNPNTASRDGSGFVDELRAADWLVLTSRWDDWWEPNDSIDFGSAEPNRVVRDLFCQRVRAGQYRLYERCERAGT